MTTLYSNKPIRPLTEKELAEASAQYYKQAAEVTNPEENYFYDIVLKSLGAKFHPDPYLMDKESHTMAASDFEKIDVKTVATKAKKLKIKSDKIKEELLASYKIGTIDKIITVKKYLDNHGYALCKRNEVHGYNMVNTRYEPEMFVVLYKEVKEDEYHVYRFPFRALESSTQTYNDFSMVWNNDFIWKHIKSLID